MAEALDQAQLSPEVTNESLDLSNIHPMLLGANNHSIMSSGGESFISSVKDGATKGIATTLLVGGASLANAAVSIGNLFGLGLDSVDPKKLVRDTDDDLSKYYTSHQEGLDIAGNLASMLVPGTLGIKALKLAQAGAAGKNMASVSNIFKSAQARNLEIAKTQIAEGTVFDTFNAARIKAVLAGAGDQALQAVAFETAIAATMQVAPYLNKDSIDVLDAMTGFGKHVAISALLGGSIGGVFEAAAVRGQLNRFLRLESKNIRPFEVTDDIEAMKIDTGTKIAQMKWNIEHKTALYETGTPLTEKEYQTLTHSIKTMEDKIKLEFGNLAGGDATLGNKLYDSMKDLKSDAFADALTAATKIGRVVDLVPASVPAHIPRSAAPIVLGKNQLIYDISGTSSHGEVLINEVVPSVADYASKGKVERMVNGNIRAGTEIFKLPTGKSIEELSPLEASTAWTSAALSPKITKDVLLDAKNLPQMQKALVDKPDTFRLINAPEGMEIRNLNDLAVFVRAEKERIVEKLLLEEKGIDEIARIVDVDKAFVESTLQGDWMLFGKVDYTSPQYAVASFNQKSLANSFELEGIAQTQKLIQAAREQAFNTTASFFKDDLKYLPTMKVDTASPVSRSAGFFTSSQGFYGNILSAAEQTGRFLLSKIYKDHQANLDLLFSARTAIQNDAKLLAEFNAIVGRLRGTDQKFVFDTTGLIFGKNTIINRDYMKEVEKAAMSLSKGKDIPNEEFGAFQELLKGKFRQPDLNEKIDLPEKIADYFRTHVQINDNRVQSFKMLMNARGQTTSIASGTVYVPPVDTTKQNFVAFIRMPEGKFGAVSEKSAIVAPTAEALQGKIDLIRTKYGNQFEIYTKKDTETYFKIKGEYDSQFMLNEPRINSALAREGILSDVVPRTDSHVFSEFDRWHMNQTSGLNRGMVELHYGQEFAELHALGKQYTDIATSRFRNISEKTVKNPYEDIIRTATNINRLPESKLWMQLNEFAEQTATTAFNVVKDTFSKAVEGKISWQDANAAMEKYGYKAPYADMYSLQLANTKIPTPVLQPFVQKMNAVLATAVLRLDFLDTIMNVISTPVLLGAEVAHIRSNLRDPEIVGALNALTSVAIPGTGGTQSLPSTFKLITNAIQNYFQKPELLTAYKQGGWIKNELDLHRELLDVSALKGHETASRLAQIGNDAVAMGVKLTGNDWSQGFTRFIAADVMRQIGAAAKIPSEELSSYINTFVNRVMGNMTASQRPILFQGAIGNAVGLFQTFQFNMAQNVFRYLETGDKKAAGLLLGMQNSLYGLQSNPAFYALNTQIVGRNTQGHEDIFSGTTKVFGKEVGDWILYGIGSNAIQTNIYSRGDLTPRFATVVPTSIGDIPFVNASIKMASGIWETAQRLTQTGAKGETLLQGVALSSINRPLAGLAQVASGNILTKDAGNLVATNDLFSFATMSRIAGGKPLDEAISLDAMYRRNVYKSMDREKLETLGAAVKTKMHGDGKDMTERDWKNLTTEYTSAGGRIDQFSGWVHRQFMAANTSVVNKARKQLLDPTVQNMMAVQGGELPDYSNRPSSFTPPSPVNTLGTTVE